MVANATLDGVNSFSLFGETYTWDDRFLLYVAVNGPESPAADTANLTLAGSDWHVRLLEFNGDGLTGTISDGLGSSGNRITLLRLGDGPTDVTLTNTEVTYIEAQSDSASVIRLGNQETRAIDMRNGDTTIIGGTGFVRSIQTGDGDDSVSLQGGADQINLGSGDNSITTGAGYVGAITMYSDTGDVNSITIGTGGVRSVGVSGGNDTVTILSGANFEQMSLGGGNDRLIVRNNAGGNQVNLGDGNNTVTMGNQGVDVIKADDGNDSFTLGSAGVRTLAMGSGTNRLTIANGSVNSVVADDGNDTVRIGTGGNIRIADLGSGTNTVTLNGDARINMLMGNEGDDIVTLNGDSRIYSLKLDGGNNVLTTADGNVESYYSFGGSNTLTIGDGGIQQIVLSGDGGTHVVNATGFVGSLQVYDDANLTAVLNGGGISVFTGRGSDDVTLAADEWLGSLIDWEGDDRVTLGAGSLLESANLSMGDDLVRLNTVWAGEISQLRGGEGSDTLDLQQMTTGVTLSLGAGLQALGAGSISFLEFENLTGTALADVLTGEAGGNVINGALGNDTLFGLAGADLLMGGRGNDSLTGGADADTFQFSAGGGRDRIADFVAGVDLIEFTAATSLASISFTRFGAGVLLKVGTTEVVVENTTVAVMNDVANFLF